MTKPQNELIENLKQNIIKNFGTPCPVIDLDIVQTNINHAQKLLRMVNVSLYNIKINHWAWSSKVFDNILLKIFN